MNFLGFDLADLLMRIPLLLLALSMHELAHGYIAMKLGDPTARNLGRLTLNPLRHIDPIGALCMLLFRFGWAKPVPVNSRYFKNPRRDIALTALAGPVSNFLMALIGMFLFRGAGALFYALPFPTDFWYSVERVVVNMCLEFAILNISLGVFNLIPVPPLDGFHIVEALCIRKRTKAVFFLYKYGWIILLVLVFTGVINFLLSFITQPILNAFAAFFSLFM